jgi:hypothetical protein
VAAAGPGHPVPPGRAGHRLAGQPRCQGRLATAKLSPAGWEAVQVGLRQLDRLTAELDPLRAELARFSRRQPGCRALRTTHFGIGPILGGHLGRDGRHPPLLLLLR